MKKILCGLLLLPAISYGQKFELGLGAGISFNTKPSDNMLFKSDKSTVNYAVSATGLYNVSNHLQAGLEVHVSELSGKSSITYTYWDGTTIGGGDKKFVYAKKAISLCAVLNGKLSMGNGYGYAGVALGYAAARHDSKKHNDNEAYRAPNGGNGVSAGLQIGFVAGLSKRLALSGEAALRYYMLNYSAHVQNNETLKYNIVSFPITVGIRYMIFSGDTKEKEKQDLMNGETSN